MLKGEKMSDKQKRIISQTKKGSILWNKNRTMPETMRQKMKGNRNGEGNKNRIFSKVTLEKMSLAKINKIGNNSGKHWKHSQISKDKFKEAQYNRRFREIPNYIPNINSELRQKRMEAGGGSHTLGEWENLKAQYNWICPCCKKSNITLTQDHIIPVSRGGSDNIENIQPLCKSCNCKKHTKTIRY